MQTAIVKRLWDLVGGVSIWIKVLGIVLGTVLMLSAVVIVQMRSVLTARLLQELGVQGVAMADSVGHTAANLVEAGELGMLQAYLEEWQHHYSNESHNTTVAYVMVRERGDGRILGRAGEAPPTDLAHLDQPLMAATGHVFAVGADHLDVMVSLAPVEAELHLGLSLVHVQRTVHLVTVQLLAITLVMVVVGFVAAFFLTWLLTRPIFELVEATHAVAAGHYNHRVARWANDEIGELATAFNRMAASLEQADFVRREQTTLRERYVSGVILAQENERQRIARELHDSTSQSLTSLLVGLQNLKLAGQDESLDRHIDELRDIVGQTLDEVRALSWRLRPSALDDLGLASALQRYIHDYQERFAIQVDYVTRGIGGRLPAEMETSIYRIVQEGLTNVARYAQADHASVMLSRRNGVVRVIVEDDGVGFDPELVQRQKRSLGLQGIRERAALLGGALTIESQPGRGTSLFVEIPDLPVAPTPVDVPTSEAEAGETQAVNTETVAPETVVERLEEERRD